MLSKMIPEDIAVKVPVLTKDRSDSVPVPIPPIGFFRQYGPKGHMENLATMIVIQIDLFQFFIPQARRLGHKIQFSGNMIAPPILLEPVPSELDNRPEKVPVNPANHPEGFQITRSGRFHMETSLTDPTHAGINAEFVASTMNADLVRAEFFCNGHMLSQ